MSMQLRLRLSAEFFHMILEMKVYITVTYACRTYTSHKTLMHVSHSPVQRQTHIYHKVWV